MHSENPFPGLFLVLLALVGMSDAPYIDPVNNIVIAQHSAREAASLPDDWTLELAFITAISDELRR
jgi:hypothetical protein